jgi:hypothetical protein
MWSSPMYRWFSCRWLDAGDPKKLTILSGLPCLSLIHGRPIALGAMARPTKPASSSTVAGTVVEPLFCNRAAWIKASRLELAPRIVVWQRPTSVRGRRGGRRKLESGTARRINLRGCVVADRASSSGHHGGGRRAPSSGGGHKCLAAASTALCSNASWLMTTARVYDHASSPLRVRERTRFAGDVARELARSAGGGGDRLNGLG